MAKRKKYIFVVTVLRIKFGTFLSVENIDSHSLGWFSKFTDAEMAILNNQLDLFEEGYYKYAVIEKVPEFLSHTPAEEHWYECIKCTWPDIEIEKIKKPEFLHNICRFGMG